MATDDAGPGEYELPSTEQYERETQQERDVELPVMGIVLPVYHRPPGRLMTAMEDFGLAGLFGDGDGDMDDMITDDGEVGINKFMRDEVVPNVVAEKTNKDVVHWADTAVRRDPEIDDFDLSVLDDEDLAALIKGMMLGEDIDDPEDELEKFPG
jgi:hypothetical protein